MSTILTDITSKLAENTWIIKIGVSLIIGLLFSWLELFFYNRLQLRLAKTLRAWDESLIKALHKPLQVFIWLMVFSSIVPVIVSLAGLNAEIGKYISPIREVLFVLTVLWFVLRFISNIEHEIIAQPADQRKGIRDRTTLRAITQLLRISIIVICILVSLQTFGISIATLLAVGGVGGIALGFAAKDTLANFLGGMMIFWDRPFSVGDWIRSPDRQIEGTVEYIGWRLTRIRTFDKRPLYVPNGTFSTIAIENPSRMLNRRIKTNIGLRYQDAPKINIILKDIEDMLHNHPEIDANQTLMVNLIEFGASSLNFMIYTFTKTTNWVKFQAVQQDVFVKTIEIITHHGAECAFPTTTLDIPAEALARMSAARAPALEEQ